MPRPLPTRWRTSPDERHKPSSSSLIRVKITLHKQFQEVSSGHVLLLYDVYLMSVLSTRSNPLCRKVVMDFIFQTASKLHTDLITDSQDDRSCLQTSYSLFFTLIVSDNQNMKRLTSKSDTLVSVDLAILGCVFFFLNAAHVLTRWWRCFLHLLVFCLFLNVYLGCSVLHSQGPL